MAFPTDEQIRIRAHQLWEQAGKPDGREQEFWHQAETELKAAGLTVETVIEPGLGHTISIGGADRACDFTIANDNVSYSDVAQSANAWIPAGLVAQGSADRGART